MVPLLETKGPNMSEEKVGLRAVVSGGLIEEGPESVASRFALNTAREIAWVFVVRVSL
jgi:hypothetical protein